MGAEEVNLTLHFALSTLGTLPLTVGGGGGLCCFPSLSSLEELCKLHFLDLQRPWAQVLIVLCLCIFILFTFQRSPQRHNIGFGKFL